MSYDLMVFDADAAPKVRQLFLEWYEQQFIEMSPYNDPVILTPGLHAWLLEMIQTFPLLNGPLAQEELPEDETAATDYSLSQNSIYADFAWSKAKEAHAKTTRLAAKHGIVFFDVSSSKGEIWFPDDNGGLTLAFSYME